MITRYVTDLILSVYLVPVLVMLESTVARTSPIFEKYFDGLCFPEIDVFSKTILTKKQINMVPANRQKHIIAPNVIPKNAKTRISTKSIIRNEKNSQPLILSPKFESL